MKRRAFVAALAGTVVVVPRAVRAQQRSYRIGYLYAGVSGSPHTIEAFRQGLREFGWVEGKNITIDFRYAEAKQERLPELAVDLVRQNVDVIVASPAPSVAAAKAAT